VYAGPPELILTGVKLGGGLTVRVAVFDPLSEAVIVTGVDEGTELEVIGKVLELLLYGTVIPLVPPLAGTVAAGLLLVNATNVPPAGANPLRVTVPVELAAPPTTLVGFNVKDVKPVATGFTVSVA
jgi:hypothetical protein